MAQAVAPVPDQRVSWTGPRELGPQATGPHRLGSLGAWGWGSTGVTTVAMIGLGGLIQVLFWLLVNKANYEVEKTIRIEIVILVIFYSTVLLIVTQRVAVGGVRLMWHDGKPWRGAGVGAGIGLALGLAAVGINSAISGHLTGDPGTNVMVSEGDLAHCAAAILIGVIAAPVVEETLFRGLLAESLRPKGMATAIWLSAAAFAAWHWRPQQLRYYAVMGAMFAVLYFKRGLVCSMTTHACFNGCLTVASIALALSPGHVVSGDGYQFTSPRGWQVESSLPGAVHLVGPSAADITVYREDLPGGSSVTPQEFLDLIEQGTVDAFLPGFVVERDTAREDDLPAGDAVRIDLTYQGHDGQVVAFLRSNDVVVLGFGSGGSVQAVRDFQRVLETLTLS